MARLVDFLLHPENTYNEPKRGAAFTKNRRNADAGMQHMLNGGYIIEEDGHPISGWKKNIVAGRELYRKASGR